VGEAVRREEASLDGARLLFEENREVIESQLGELDALHRTGPAAPDLPNPTRSMALEEFVTAALRAEGTTVTDVGDGRLDVVPRDAAPFEAMIAVDGVGNRPPPGVTMYAPGEPAFEALGQRWAEGQAALVYDHPSAPFEAIRDVAERWCERIAGAVLVDVRRTSAQVCFQGEIDCAAKAVVAHDSYERIVSVDLVPDGHARITVDPPADRLVAAGVRVDDLTADAEHAVKAAVCDDPDIGAFCRFYEERLAEERAEHATGDEAAARAAELFAPTVEARVIGVRGHRYEVVSLHLTVQVEPGEQYEADLEILPATAQVVREPEAEVCEQSGRRVPASWLDTCSISNRRALRHLLRPLDGTGQRALLDHLARSALTGRLLLLTEMEKSAVSGAPGEPELLVASEVSGRRALPSETGRCEFTGATVLVDELVKSEVSGRVLRMDQQATSALSGVVGHSSEFVTCAASKALVLPTEAERSDVSGKLIRRDWIVRSERPPHRVGSKKESVRCAETGKLLLSDETGWCWATMARVDASLLVKSEASGYAALSHKLVVCKLSGMRVLPVEMADCIVTGERARRALMVRSAASGAHMLPGQEVLSELSGKPMAPGEAFDCPWLGLRVLPQEAAPCARTGLKVSTAALNAAGELSDLRRLLEDARTGTEVPEIVAWLQHARPGSRFDDATAAFAIAAPTGKLWAVAVRSEWFFFRRYLGCVLAGSLSAGTLRMVGGGYTIGSLDLFGWAPDQDVTIPAQADAGEGAARGS
jgi:hypothetical protein